MAAEIRCPMCGKPNPANAESCRYCQARLKPVRPGGASGGESPEGDEPDWLRDLRADDPGGQKSTPAGKDAGSDVPDWLARLRQKASDEPQKSSDLFQDQDASDASDLPDWMKEEQGSASTPSDFGGSDDWLSRLGDKEDESATPDSGEATGSGEVDLSGWLSSLDEDHESESKPRHAAGQTGSVPPAAGRPDFGSFSGGNNLFEEEDQSGEGETPAQADDWLSKMNFDEPAPSGAQSSDEMPSWDNRLFADEPANTQNSAGPDDFGNWLRDFGDTPAEPPDQPGSKPVADAGGEEASSGWGLTGWLKNEAETPEAGLPASAAPSGAPAGDELPDWLGGAASAFGAASAASDDFSSLSADGVIPPAEDETPLAADDEMPDWMQAVGETRSASEGQPPQQPSSGEAMPDWLSGEASSTDEQSQAEETPGENVPSWMMGASFDQDTPASAQPEDAGPMPDWLSGLGGEQPEAALPPQEEPAGEEQEGMPVWLSGGFDALEEPPQVVEVAPGEGDLPDWFASFDSQQGVSDQPAPGALSEEPSLGQEIPLELQFLAGDEAAAQEKAQSEQPDFGFSPFSIPDEEEPAASPEPALAEPVSPMMEEQPDWLQSLKAAGEEDAGEPVQLDQGKGTGPLPFIDEGLPDWMSGLKGQPPAEEPVPALIPVEEYPTNYTQADKPFDVDLPDWLAEEGAQQGAQEKKSADEAVAGDLAQAELPSWVAAMRPVETAIQGDAGAVDTDQRVEKAGPLSGLRGVLPADERVVNYRKLPVYSVKLRVSEKQKGHSGLLDSLVGQETQPLVLPAARSQAPQFLQRALVALLLLLVLAAVWLTKIEIMPAPTYSPEVWNLYDQVEALPADQAVLLAVDYEPGLSGEMRFAASMVIDHLMARNVPMSIVSTVPTGPAMADSLLQQVQLHRPEYSLADSVENLGYLPGGTISLVEFALNPKGSTPKTTDGQNAWDRPPMAGIEKIDGFGGIIVITDRAEVGRDWIEQVQPYLGNVPLLMVSSAQAAPMLQPYVESQQVQGLVSGLMGGALYGQYAGSPSANPALEHFGSYQVGALLGFVLVLVGVVFSAVVSLVTRNKKNREK